MTAAPITRLRNAFHHPGSLAIKVLIYLSALLTVGTMAFVVLFILIRGIPNLTPSLFAWEYNTENVSMMPAIINTLVITVLTLLVAVPIGVCAAVFLTEYAPRGSKVVALIRITTQTLSGIPSIVFGLFGFLAFVIALHWGYSMIAGVLTLAMMVLPLIIRTTEEAMLAVPESYREGSFGLGAGKLRTIFCIVIPAAMPGILSGVILSIGRIVGETAALIFTAGTSTSLSLSPGDSARTLAVHMYCLLSEGLYTEQAYATAVVLLVMVIGINFLSKVAASRLQGKKESV